MDYLSEVKDKIQDEIENYDVENKDLEEIKDEMMDSVTGNDNGSFTMNRQQAMENVLGDGMDLLNEWVENVGKEEVTTIGQFFLDNNWEALDVTCRMEVYEQAWNELEDEGFFDDLNS